MDENGAQAQQKSSMSKWLIPVTVLGLIVIAVVAFYALGQQNPTTAPVETARTVTSAPVQEDEIMEEDTEGAMSESEYTDGEYAVTGNYVSPGGPREVNVTLTLADGVITDAVFEGFATDPNSKRFQGEFKDNFEPMVIGKNIDEVELTKVAGSSLTPKGFMDAVEKVKTEAQS